MKITFPSIASPNTYLYTFDSNSYATSGEICNDFLYKKILPDGTMNFNTVVSVDLFGDYLASLSLAMLTDDNLCREISWRIPSDFNKNEIEFAASVIYKSGKSRYFSTELRKISSVASKRFDRRFEFIDSNMDGSPKSIFSIIIGNNGGSGLFKYGLATAIRDWFFYNGKKKTKRKNSYMEPAAEFLEWTSDHTKINEIRNGWEACKFAIAAYTAKQNVESSISCFKNYALQRKLEQ